MVQALTAAVTLWALYVAISISRRDVEWRQDQFERETSFTWEIVASQVVIVRIAILEILVEIDEFADPRTPAKLPKNRVNHVDFHQSHLELEPIWKIYDKLVWLPPDVSKPLGQVMTQAPMYGAAAKEVLDWKGDVPTLITQMASTKEVGHHLVSMCDRVLKARYKRPDMSKQHEHADS